MQKQTIMQKIDGWAHVYRRSNGTLYYVRRPPVDVAPLMADKQFKRSLKHRDERTPGFKATYDAVHKETELFITKLRSGISAPEARREHEVAVTLAQRYGFDYRPVGELADAPLEELFARLEKIEKKVDDPKSEAEVRAIMGTAPKPTLTLSQALGEYVVLCKHEIRDKNEGQRKRWRNPLELAVGNFVQVVSDKHLDEITREDALKFRSWWIDERIGKDVATANTANKNLMALRKIFRVVNDTLRLGLENPFSGLTIAGDKAATRVSLTREWLEATLLSKGALAESNKDAQGIIHAMADTGARLNEISGLEENDIKLEADIPHIIIRGNSTRSLKTDHSERIIPLVGTALAAMSAHPKGFPRYAGKNATASAAINKFLRENNLLPDSATLYGLRHGFQDRLIEVEVPERIQADLMGHKTLRPKYGKGASLSQMRDWLLKTALHPKTA
jgi:integrase